MATKWNKKSILAAVPEISKEADISPFDGKTVDEFVAWMKHAEKHGVIVKGLETEEDQRKAFKTVYVVPDAGEDVQIQQPEGADTAEADEDEMEAKAEGDDDLDEESSKAYKAFLKVYQKSNKGKNMGAPFMASVHEASRGKSMGRYGDRRSAVLKSYDRAVKNQTPLSRTGTLPVFEDGERMEAFNALARLSSMKNYDYSQKSADERIATKSGLLGQNSTGGALVFGEYFPELIENFSTFGAARAAAGVEPMREGVKTVSKITADVTVGDIGEGDPMTNSDATFGNVQLVAKKSYALVKLSMELLDDSAFDVTDIIGRSMMRALREYEDDCYFNSANNREGISSKIGANSTLDANLAARSTANWAGYTETDIQDLLGTLPDWVKDDPKFGIACSWQFYMRVLRRFAMSAGGNTGQMVLGGVAGPGNTSTWGWDGIPIYINNKAPKTYSADQIDAYAGAFSYATKFGVVTGSETVATTDQRWFDEDMFGIKMTQRWAINPHDVNNKTLANGGSGIVALKA